MTSWAKWTAKTVLLTTGFAAAGGGLPGVAFAGAGGTNTGNTSVLSGNHVGTDRNRTPASIPVSFCGNAAAILGVATAGCAGGAELVGDAPSRFAGSRTHGTVTRPAGGWWAGGTEPAGGVEPRRASMSAGNLSIGSGNEVHAPVSTCGNAAAVLGDSSAGCVGLAPVGDWVSYSSSKAHREPVGRAGKARKISKTRKTSTTGESKRRTSHPTKTQLAGLGVLPGIATVPGLGDVTSLSPLAGLTGGGALMSASPLSAYQQTYQERALPGTADSGMNSGMNGGMSGTSLATLAAGALLAGAASLKLASRRSRDRRTGVGQVSA